MSDSPTSIFQHAGMFAIGVLFAGYAAQAAFWTEYMRANPAVGMPSTSTGSSLFVLVLFLLGVGMAYVAVVRGLAVSLGNH